MHAPTQSSPPRKTLNNRALSFVPKPTRPTRSGGWEVSKRKCHNIHISGKIGIHQPEIVGRFRRITAHQITMAWWLHMSGNITRKQLRVYFAAHEMHEQRKYARPAQQDTGRHRKGAQGSRTHALYRVEEIAALVCKKEQGGSPRALAGLRADIRHLAKLGLVTIEPHSIVFAVSIDEIRLGVVDDISGFWTMFNQIPNSKRTVPVPRRSLRALAGVGDLVGNSKAVSGVMLAMLIRSLFWHKESASYRVDGRTKAAWIVKVFGLSRRAVTDARATLIELGWIEDLVPPQWALNRWGSHDRINPDWSPTPSTPSSPSSPQNTIPSLPLLPPTAHPTLPTNPHPQSSGGVPQTQPLSLITSPNSPSNPSSPYTGSASPQGQINTGSASPCLNKKYSSSTKKNLNTRRLGAEPTSTANQTENKSPTQTSNPTPTHSPNQTPSQEPGLRPGKTGVSSRNDWGRRTGRSASASMGGLGSLKTTAAREEKSGSRGKKNIGKRYGRAGLVKRGQRDNLPNIRDIQLGHMQETADLLELYRQAIAIGLAKPSEAGRLDFLALAERAKAHGKRAGALLYWLLREKKTVFITQSEEDAAVQRIRELHNPDNGRSRKQSNRQERWGGHEQARGTKPLASKTTMNKGVGTPDSQQGEDEQFVMICIRIAKQKRIDDPYRVARVKDWSQQRWEKAFISYEAKQWERLQKAHSSEENDDE